MPHDERFQELARSALSGRLSRRDVLRRAAVLGLSAPAIAALLAACGGGSSKNTPTTSTSGASTSTSTSPSGSASPVGSPVGSPMASPSAEASPSGSPTAMTFDPKIAPSVPDPSKGKQYSGQKITYYGDSVGAGNEFDKVLAAQFTKDTGIEINVVPKPKDSTQNFATYQRFFQGKSSDVDVMMLDVVWPGQIGQHLIDLTQALGDEAKLHYDTIIKNNTVDGKLVAIPWFGDFGMLYFRTDLLQKYNYDKPPTTWDELQDMATKIKDGEKANASFQGFVFQGDAYEGLTCNALEWIASSGGGTIMDESGKVTVNNDKAVAMLNKAKGWIGNIAPRDVTSFQEDDARNVFQGGNAAFMRNWPYAYALGKDSKIADKFDIATFPGFAGQEGAGVLGGYNLGISAYSKNPEGSLAFIEFATKADQQKIQVTEASLPAVVSSVYDDPEVKKAMPFAEQLRTAIEQAQPRPVSPVYPQISEAVYNNVYEALQGNASPDEAASKMNDEIQKALETF